MNFATIKPEDDDDDISESEESENDQSEDFNSEQKTVLEAENEITSFGGGYIKPISDETKKSFDNSAINDTPTFESIKNHFDTLKKVGHTRKTSSGRSRNFDTSNLEQNSKNKSLINTQRYDQNDKAGFDDYSLDFKKENSNDLANQDSLSQDITFSVDEDGEYFSRCWFIYLFNILKCLIIYYFLSYVHLSNGWNL